MPKLQRNKGARFEREIVNLLRAAGIDARRNLQYRGASVDGADITITTPTGAVIAVECKRRSTLPSLKPALVTCGIRSYYVTTLDAIIAALLNRTPAPIISSTQGRLVTLKRSALFTMYDQACCATHLPLVLVARADKQDAVVVVKKTELERIFAS